MEKKQLSWCVICHQKAPSNTSEFMEMKSCNDTEGHLYARVTHYEMPYTQKFPFQYSVEIQYYTFHTTSKEKYEKFLEAVVRNNIHTVTGGLLRDLEASGFSVHKRLLTSRAPDAGDSAASQTLSPQSGESTPEVDPAATQRR